MGQRKDCWLWSSALCSAVCLALSPPLLAAQWQQTLSQAGEGGVGYQFPSDIDIENNTLLLGGGLSGVSLVYQRDNRYSDWQLSQQLSPAESGSVGAISGDWLLQGEGNTLKLFRRQEAAVGGSWQLGGVIAPPSLRLNVAGVLLSEGRLFVPYQTLEATPRYGVLIYGLIDQLWRELGRLTTPSAIEQALLWNGQLLLRQPDRLVRYVESRAGSNDWRALEEAQFQLAPIEQPVQTKGNALALALTTEQGREYRLYQTESTASVSHFAEPVAQITNPNVEDNPQAVGQYFSFSGERLVIAEWNPQAKPVLEPEAQHAAWVYARSLGWQRESRYQHSNRRAVLWDDELFLARQGLASADSSQPFDGGALDILRFSSSRWQPQQTLTAKPANAGARFGSALAVSEGAWWLAESPVARLDFNGSAVAQLGANEQGLLGEQQTLSSSFDYRDAEQRRYGAALAVSGNKAVLALQAVVLDDQSPAAHELHTFERQSQGQPWRQSKAHTLRPESCVFGSQAPVFALEGEDLLLECPQEASASTLLHYRWQAETWRRESENPSDFQASRLLMDEGRVIRANGQQLETGLLEASSSYRALSRLAQAHQGVFLDTDWLYVGTDENTVQAYRWSGKQPHWRLMETLPAPADSEGDFGQALFARGDFLAVSDRGPQPESAPPSRSEQSRVYLYQRSLNPPYFWQLMNTLLSPEGRRGDAFGATVLAEADTLLIGAPEASGPYGHRSGLVHQYRLGEAQRSAPDVRASWPDQVAQGEVVDFALSAFDADGEPVTIEQIQMPAWLSYNQDTGRLQGQAPMADQVDSLSVRLQSGEQVVTRVKLIEVGQPSDSRQNDQPTQGGTVVTPGGGGSGGGALGWAGLLALLGLCWRSAR